MTTIISGLYDLLTSENKQKPLIDLKGVEIALHEIAISINGVSDSIDKLSDSVIATVKDEHELHHYGHLKTAVRSLVAARVDPIVLNDAKRELDCAKKYCVSGVYWIALSEYENLVGCVTIDTLRHAFAYSKSDTHFENIQKIFIYFYLLKLSLPLDDPIVQDVFYNIIIEIEAFNLNTESRNKFSELFITTNFLSKNNYELLKEFTQKPYLLAINDSIESLNKTDIIPASIEEIKLPVLSESKPVISDKNILNRGNELVNEIKKLEILIAENNKCSESLSDFSFKDFYGLFIVSFVLIFSGFIYYPLFSFGALLFLAVFVSSMKNFFMRIIFPHKKSKLEKKQFEIQTKWKEIIKKTISISKPGEIPKNDIDT